MTNRENFFSIARREGYSYIPVGYSLCPSLAEKYSQELSEFIDSLYPKKNMKKIEERPGQMVEFKTYPPETYEKYFNPPLKENSNIDKFGVGHEKGSESAMHMTYMRNPLKDMDTLEELEAYPYPEPIDDPEFLAKIKAINEEYIANDQVVCGNMQCTIWERAWYLRSMERLMMDMLCEEELATFVLDKITDIAVKEAEFFAKTSCDFIFLGDDIGMQRTPMMSDEVYVDWLKPRIKRVIDAARAIKPDILVYYHSCGYVEPFIEHFIDVGIDVLNPVQPECMDFKEIYDKYGDRISFHGTIGTQTTMPFGTPEEVRQAVLTNLEIAGKKGGLFPCPTHLLEPEVPVENIKAYIQACRDFA